MSKPLKLSLQLTTGPGLDFKSFNLTIKAINVIVGGLFVGRVKPVSIDTETQGV